MSWCEKKEFDRLHSVEFRSDHIVIVVVETFKFEDKQSGKMFMQRFFHVAHMTGTFTSFWDIRENIIVQHSQNLQHKFNEILVKIKRSMINVIP